MGMEGNGNWEGGVGECNNGFEQIEYGGSELGFHVFV